MSNTYSVPSRLIGTAVLVRVRSEHLEVYVGSQQTARIPRLVGKGHHAINYRHVIWSLLRKPGAFAHYRYREEFFPLLVFRQAYDRLLAAMGERADREYLQVLHLAATKSESDVATALSLLLEAQALPQFAAVQALVAPVPFPRLAPVAVNLALYDMLLAAREGLHG